MGRAPETRELTADEIIIAVGLLPDADRAKVVACLTGERLTVVRTDDHRVGLVYDELGDYLKRKSRTVPPFGKYRKRAEFGAFAASAVRFLGYIDRHFKPETEAERMKIGYVIFDVLARRLELEGTPVGLLPMARQLGRVPEVVDLAFPGYRVSGLLPLIAKAHLGRV